jgi:hypothetical protein
MTFDLYEISSDEKTILCTLVIKFLWPVKENIWIANVKPICSNVPARFCCILNPIIILLVSDVYLLKLTVSERG